ncbi:restriction endonuclease subunit S [Lactococcus cremoris]|uniref:restriction endonuclease subunit S n=1 Tax=Lactococcus lactis subsp. cremoris TaxID=1359 RepID=UPI0037BE3257
MQNKLKQLEKKYSIDWRNEKAGNYFEVRGNPQLNKDSFNFSENGEYPYFTRTVLNNGVAGYVDYLDEEHKISGNSIAVGMLGMQFFYMERDFYAGQFTKTLFPRFEGLNRKNVDYFISLLNKHQVIYQGSLVRHFEKLFNETELKLPFTHDKLNLDYIEEFISTLEAERLATLEAERLATLEAYLQATGLKDVELSEAEAKSLEILGTTGGALIEWREFTISELFTISTPKKKFNANTLKFNGKYPYIARGEKNNGVRGYITEDEQYLNAGNTISFGQDTATMFYCQGPSKNVGFGSLKM